MSFEGTTINKLNGGLGRSNSTGDNILLLVLCLAAASIPADVEKNKVYPMVQPSDANNLGLTAAWDANKGITAREEINRFFTYAPEAPLRVLITDKLTPATVVADADFIAAIRATPDIKGIVISGTTTLVSALVDQVENVQQMVDSLAAEKRLIDFVILEGVGAAEELAIGAYPDLRAKNAPNVSVSIAQDADFAGLAVAYSKRSDVGSVAGMLAARQVNENLGSVNILNKPSASKGNPDYPLSVGARYAKPSLSDGTLVGPLSLADKKSLTDKGYIYAGSYDGYTGVFFNSSPTAVQVSSDYAYIENNRVWNKAARLIRTALIPQVKGVVKKDPKTGFIRTTTISRWTAILKAALEKLVVADEISGFDVYIDPKQVLSESAPLKIKAQIVADEIVHEFEVDLGLTDKIS